MNSKERCLATIHGQAVDRIPVFPLLMFFAREQAGITYREYATNGFALADAQLAVHDRFAVDAITACSDAYREAADLGAEMAFPEEKPPFARTPLVQSESDLAKLGRPDPMRQGSRMFDRVSGIEAMVKAVGDKCLVLGWVEMPFAGACSLVGVSEFMMLMVDDPALAHRILEFVTQVEIDFALAQVQAGAPMIGAGDAAASLISLRQYREFAMPYEQRVVNAVHDAGGMVKIHICGNTSHLLADLAQVGADLYNVDHLVNLEKACETYAAAGRCFKGNLDPVTQLMQATPEQCRAICAEKIRQASGCRFMLSAGCEVPEGTPVETFQEFCQAPQG